MGSGDLRIRVGFRLWRPKREGMAPYRTKLELAQDLVSDILRIGLIFEYVLFDLWYNARWFTQWLDRQQVLWVSTLKGNALITDRGRTRPVAEWAQHLPRRRIVGPTCAWIGTVHLSRYGPIRTRRGHKRPGRTGLLVSTDRMLLAGELKVAQAWALKERFRQFWEYTYLGAAQRFFGRWFSRASHSRLKPMAEVAWMIRRHLPDVLTTCVIDDQCRARGGERDDPVGEEDRPGVPEC